MIDIGTLKKQPKYARMSNSSLRKVAAYQQLCQDAIALFGRPSKRYPMAKLVKMYQADLANREKQAQDKKARDAQKRKTRQAQVKPSRNKAQAKFKDAQKPGVRTQVTKAAPKAANRRSGAAERFTAKSSGRVYNVPVKSILSALYHGKEVKVVRRVKPIHRKSQWSNLYYDKHLWRNL